MIIKQFYTEHKKFNIVIKELQNELYTLGTTYCLYCFCVGDSFTQFHHFAIDGISSRYTVYLCKCIPNDVMINNTNKLDIYHRLRRSHRVRRVVRCSMSFIRTSSDDRLVSRGP